MQAYGPVDRERSLRRSARQLSEEPAEMRLPRAWLWFPLVAATVMACGGSPGTPATSAPAATTAAAADSPSASAQTVALTGFAFQPATLQVKAGTQVAYQNKDQIGHTVTNGENGAAASGAAFDQEVAIGATVTITFDKAGTVKVTCKIHPTMNQTVEVTP
jgi:plastocyanin